MAFIGLGKINTNLIPIVVGCVFCFLNRLLNQYEGTSLFKNVMLTNIFISFSDLFTIVPYIIFKVRSKKVYKHENKEITPDETQETKFEYLYEESYDIEDDVQGKGKFIVLIGLIFFVNYLIFVYIFALKTNTWIMYILFTSIFYYLFFKSKLYRHHYLSIVIILIIGLVIDFVEGNIQKDFTDNIKLILLSFLRVILLSLDYVLIKYTMEKKYASPYEIGFYNGLINLIIFIVGAVIDHYFYGRFDYKEYFDSFNGKELLVILGLMVTQFGIYMSLFIIDKKDTPCHIFIVFVFGQLAYYYNLTEISIVSIICLILILFFSLIFNEIIELNFCGLSQNTRKNIILRGDSEVVGSLLVKGGEDNYDTQKEAKEIELENSSISS